MRRSSTKVFSQRSERMHERFGSFWKLDVLFFAALALFGVYGEPRSPLARSKRITSEKTGALLGLRPPASLLPGVAAALRAADQSGWAALVRRRCAWVASALEAHPDRRLIIFHGDLEVRSMDLSLPNGPSSVVIGPIYLPIEKQSS